jgi:hypothetical protein
MRNLIMKKISWKSALVGKLAVAAGTACLLLFTVSATVAHAQPIITFDTLSGGEVKIPNGYANLQWDNFFTVNGETYNKSGYQAGVVSKNNVAFNAYGEPADVYVDSGSFTPIWAYLTAAWNDNLKVQVTGYLHGRMVFSHTYTLSATKPTLCIFGATVDELDFDSYGGTFHAGYDGGGEHFAMDNFFVVP